MKTRTALMLVIALLVVAALPAQANDNEQDVCNGLRNALDVLENHSQASQRAIENVTTRAEAAGCVDTLYPESQEVCETFGGAFTADVASLDPSLLPLWKCDWTFANSALGQEQARELDDACNIDADGQGFFPAALAADGTATGTCWVSVVAPS